MSTEDPIEAATPTLLSIDRIKNDLLEAARSVEIANYKSLQALTNLETITSDLLALHSAAIRTALAPPPPAPAIAEQPTLPLPHAPRRRPPIIYAGRALERCLCDAGFDARSLATILGIRSTAVHNWIGNRNGMKAKHRAEVRRLILRARAAQDAREATQ